MLDSEAQGYAGLSAVIPEVFLRALRVLESVAFDLTTFSTDQVTAILTMQTEGSQGELKKLEMCAY